MSSNPTLAEVLSSAMLRQENDIHTALPGKIKSYDATTNTATVSPLIERSIFDDEGNESAGPYADIHSVPVLWPRSGGYTLRMPVSAGDTCLLLVSEADIEQWQESGTLSAPEDDRRFDLSDAVAVMGLFSAPAEDSAPTDPAEAEAGMLVGKEGEDSRIFIDDSEIRMGGMDSSDYAVLESKLQTQLDAIKTELDSLATSYTSLLTAYAAHQHATIVPLIPLPGPQPGPTVPLATLPAADPVQQAPLIPHVTTYIKGDTNSELVKIKK